jgi:hypothetical protein
MASHTQLHTEVLSLLRQHCSFRDQRHMTMLASMVAAMTLSQTVVFECWRDYLPLGKCLAASWQRRCQRWFSNVRIDVSAIYGPLIIWAMQQWQKPDKVLHLALDTTMLWNSHCVVMLSCVCHGRAIPVLWTTLEHSSASVSAEVVISLLQKADQLLQGFGTIMVLADRGFPSNDLLSWFDDKPRWKFLMRLKSDTIAYGIGAPLGCEVRKVRLGKGLCRGFRNAQIWTRDSRRVNLLLARPTGLSTNDPWYLVTSAELCLDLVWTYGHRFCCEQLFRDQKSGVFQLESSRIRDPERLNRLLLVLSIGVLIGSLQGFAVSLSGQRNQVDAHWERCLSFLRIGLSWMQQCVADSSKTLLAWAPIPLRKLESCIPSQSSQQNQQLPWFSKVDLPPPLDRSVPALVS